MPEKRYMSTKTMAHMYDVSVDFITDNIKAGNLTAVNISKSVTRPNWRIRVEDADEFFNFLAHRAEIEERKLLTA
ncbi:hypothetical protein HMPREF2526_08425 [Corynebacterium sp. HMSC070E08]|nr:hypothetical protein HMPREF2526_08425 [Corynebacterium sp. HMSC070E08]